MDATASINSQKGIYHSDMGMYQEAGIIFAANRELSRVLRHLDPTTTAKNAYQLGRQ
jgi:hypothetical protein